MKQSITLLLPAEASEWIDGVIFDEPERNEAVERVLHPERYRDMDEILDEAPVSTVIDGEVKTFPNADALMDYENQRDSFPYSVGDTVYLEDGKPFIIENIGLFDIQLRDPSLAYPILRAESRENFSRLMERYPQPEPQREFQTETVAVYPAEENHLPYDIVVESSILRNRKARTAENFRITDEHLGEGVRSSARMADAINFKGTGV